MSARTPVGVHRSGRYVLLVDPTTHGEAFNVYADAYGNAYPADQVSPVQILDEPAGVAPSLAAGSSDTLAGSSALSGAGGPAIPGAYESPAVQRAIIETAYGDMHDEDADDVCSCGHPDCGAC